MTNAGAVLKEFKVTKKFFVGIDSDGCVFDTMYLFGKGRFLTF